MGRDSPDTPPSDERQCRLAAIAILSECMGPAFTESAVVKATEILSKRGAFVLSETEAPYNPDDYDMRGEVPILKSPTDKQHAATPLTDAFQHEQQEREIGHRGRRDDTVSLINLETLDFARTLERKLAARNYVEVAVPPTIGTQSAVERRYANPFKVLTSEWQTDRGENQVTCHSRMVDGVLCRWWGDDEPPGTAKIDAAASAQSAKGALGLPAPHVVPEGYVLVDKQSFDIILSVITPEQNREICMKEGARLFKDAKPGEVFGG